MRTCIIRIFIIDILIDWGAVLPRPHLVDVEKHPGLLNTEAAEQLLDVIRTYSK